VFALLAGSLLFGCASEISLRAPDVDLRKARLAFMPSMVALYRIEGCDLPFDDWRSKAGRTKIDGWLRFYAASAHGRLVDLREVVGTDITANRFYEVMNTLTQSMFVDWGRRPIGMWRLDPLQSWANALHADYLVFVSVRGSVLRQEAENVCRNEIRSPLRRAALAVVEAQTGRVVRFQAIKLEDVETPHIAEAVRKLTESLDIPAATAK
jgi:hypothetical protein